MQSGKGCRVGRQFLSMHLMLANMCSGEERPELLREDDKVPGELLGQGCCVALAVRSSINHPYSSVEVLGIDPCIHAMTRDAVVLYQLPQ